MANPKVEHLWHQSSSSPIRRWNTCDINLLLLQSEGGTLVTSIFFFSNLKAEHLWHQSSSSPIWRRNTCDINLLLLHIVLVLHFVEFVFPLSPSMVHITWEMNIHNYSKIFPILLFHWFLARFSISFFKLVKQKWKGCIVPKSPYGFSFFYNNFSIMSNSSFFICLEKCLQKIGVFRYLFIFKSIHGEWLFEKWLFGNSQP